VDRCEAADITYAFDPAVASTGPPVVDYRVQSTPGAPGGSLTYTMTVKGVRSGDGSVTTETSTPLVKGITIEVDKITAN
jgi:hypothetical protein